jgi:tetratricopeptide (TPR) repeat protein
MKIFVGHSFDDRDSAVIGKFLKFLGSREELEVVTGEKVQNQSVADKVRSRISESDAFAGIFTCDEEIKTGKCFLRKGKDHTTSNWVIQESGFALGRDKPIILIVERGICRFPELQGDLELIHFDRNNLAEPFIRLNQMIDSLLGKEKAITSAPVYEKLQAPEEAEKEEERETPVGKEDAFTKYQQALDTNDPAMLRKAYETDLLPALSSDEEEQLVWKGITLRIAHSLGDSEAYVELVELAERNKDKPEVVKQLAIRLKHMGAYGKAREKYLEVKDLYEINNASDKVNIVDCYVEANKCLALEGKYEEAIISLTNLLLEEKFKGQQAQLLRGLADMSKDSQDIEKFLIYAEGCLDIDPTDTNLRFSLAYHYSEKGHQKLSLLHNKKLTDSVDHPTGLNNLGVQYERLNLKGKSIKSFYEAADHKVTLAMANLARRYLQQGFIQDASNMIKRANILSKEGIEVHGNVGYFKNQLDSQVSEEDTKEKEILMEAEKEREFRVKYGSAFLCDKVVQRDHLEGVWETPWGNLEISFDKKGNTIKVEQRVELEPLDPMKHRLVSIDGTIINLSGTYSIKVVDITEWSWGPSKDTVYTAVGYMVMSMEENKIIHIMEKTKEDKITFVSWRRTN